MEEPVYEYDKEAAQEKLREIMLSFGFQPLSEPLPIPSCGEEVYFGNGSFWRFDFMTRAIALEAANEEDALKNLFEDAAFYRLSTVEVRTKGSAGTETEEKSCLESIYRRVAADLLLWGCEGNLCDFLEGQGFQKEVFRAATEAQVPGEKGPERQMPGWAGEIPFGMVFFRRGVKSPETKLSETESSQTKSFSTIEIWFDLDKTERLLLFTVKYGDMTWQEVYAIADLLSVAALREPITERIVKLSENGGEIGGEIRDSFAKFEKEVIEAIAGEEPTLKEGILTQYARSKKIRKLDPCGFYTNFELPDGCPPMETTKCTIGGAVAKPDGLPSGLGFILFLKKGKISCLEGYTYGSEQWNPGMLRSYTVIPAEKKADADPGNQPQVIILPENEWREENIKIGCGHLKNAVMTFVPEYHRYDDLWDHEHCDGCMAPIGEFAEELHSAYRTHAEPSKTAWLCEKCYEVAKDLLNLSLDLHPALYSCRYVAGNTKNRADASASHAIALPEELSGCEICTARISKDRRDLHEFYLGFEEPEKKARPHLLCRRCYELLILKEG